VADRTAAKANFEKLVQALASVGLATEVRNGGKHSLLVFVKVASEEYLFGEVYRSRYGILIVIATAFSL
jgi:anoctamin-10